MKAILVIDDLPNDINIEDVGITYIIQQRNGLLVKAQVESVPLKLMPKKKRVDKWDKKRAYYRLNLGYTDIVYASNCLGYNACIDEITGKGK